MKYSRVLLEHCPDGTTELFIDYYTGRYKPKEIIPDAELASPGGVGSSTIQNLASLLPFSYHSASNTGSPGTPSNRKASVPQPSAVQNIPQEPPAYPIPKPRTAFSAFVEHPEKFVTFLEECLRSEGLAKPDRSDICTTLFEMYLKFAKEKKGEERNLWSEKAKRMIDDANVSLEGGVPLLALTIT